MIRVTERAATVVQELLAAQEAEPGQGLKLVRNPAGGVAATIAPPQEGDELLGPDEAPVVIVDAAIAPELDGVVVDIQPGEGPGRRAQITLQRPAAGS